MTDVFTSARATPRAPAVVAVLFALGLALLGWSSAHAEEEAGSFLTPFPDNEIYQLSVVGDTFAEGLLSGMVEAMGTDTRLNIQRSVRELPGVMTADFETRMTEFEAAIDGTALHVAIVMVGENDRVALKGTSSQRKVAIATPEWLAEYSRRIDRIMKVLKRRNPGIYWVGLPNLSRGDAGEQAQKMNDVIRERAYLNGIKYIDAFAGFSDEAGNYTAYGPDLQGKIRVLRQADGEHFTDAGNRKLAHFVEKDLRQDLNQAKAARTVPLLGAEAEQAKINPDNAVKIPAPSSPVAPPAGSPQPAAPVVKAEKFDGTAPSAAADGEQKADNGKVLLKVVNGGREETQTVEIVRPPIPASVVALMARRETSGQGGDMLVDQLAGGQTLMSSITPAGTKARGKLSPTQAPYFRLLVKGERLTPKPGRADDVAWPRGENSSGAPAKAEPQPRG